MSRKCSWCLGFRGDDPIFCPAEATQYDPECPGSTLCDDHADDYASTWGPESLRPIEEIDQRQIGKSFADIVYVIQTRNGDAFVRTADAELMRGMLAGSDQTTTKLGVIWRRDTRHTYERWCDLTPVKPSVEALPLHEIAKELRA